MNAVKKTTGYILIGIIVFSTIIAVLGIWEIIELKDIMIKSLKSGFVIFIAAVVMLFIIAVVMRDEKPEETK